MTDFLFVCIAYSELAVMSVLALTSSMACLSSRACSFGLYFICQCIMVDSTEETNRQHGRPYCSISYPAKVVGITGTAQISFCWHEIE